MSFFLHLIAIIVAVVYFLGIGGMLIFAFVDRQKDSLTENRVVAVLLFIGLIVAPAFGILYSLR